MRICCFAGQPKQPAPIECASKSFAAVLDRVRAVLWVLYNRARWGTWSDIGYTTWYHQDQAGMPTGSPFRLEYLPYNCGRSSCRRRHSLPSFPWLRPEFSGVALTWTSPALVLAFLARSPVRWVGALWVAALLAAIPNLLYYVNGFAQFGMRHALDFEPFLVALMMLGVRDRCPRGIRLDRLLVAAGSGAIGTGSRSFEPDAGPKQRGRKGRTGGMTGTSSRPSPQRIARAAGASYLITVIGGLFAEESVRGKLIDTRRRSDSAQHPGVGGSLPAGVCRRHRRQRCLHRGDAAALRTAQARQPSVFAARRIF